MMSEQVNRKSYRILSKKERVGFIKKMTKSTFKYRDYIKCEEDWWDLTNFVLWYAHRSSKMGINFEAIVGQQNIKETATDLKQDIVDLFFAKVQEEHAYYSLWPQGRRQSFTYKWNRITENINEFLRRELREPDNDRWHNPLRLQYDIQSIYSSGTRYGTYSGGVGIVEAYNMEEAKLQFEMFVFPLVGISNGVNDGASFFWEGYCPEENKTELYVYHNGKLIEKKMKEISDLKENIDRLSEKINNSQLIIDSARSNLLANMGVEN